MSDPTRRVFLGRMTAGLGGAWLGAPLADLLGAHQHARHAATLGHAAPLLVLTPGQAPEVAAMAAEIIPTDATPGATEAHVVSFIDHILTTFEKDKREAYQRGLAMLEARTRELVPDAARFSALPGEARRRVLTSIEQTEFFDLVRTHVIMGFFGDPNYGGNAGAVGWTLIGFEPAFAYQPPFGDYDAEASAPKPQD